MTQGTPVADRLYGIMLRPQEMALYGDRLRISLHYAPMCDDPTAPATAHFTLLVLEGVVAVPDEAAEFGELAGQELQVLKVGWELELSTAESVAPQAMTEHPEEVPRLLDRIADTVNELARRAGLEAPFGPDVVRGLLSRYREG